MNKAIFGQKLGMTQFILENGSIVPVTVIYAPKNEVIQTKTMEVDGYAATQVGFGEIKPTRVNKPKAGHFAKVNTEAKRFLREFKLEHAPEIGSHLTVEQFQVGEKVDIAGISKGKGFAGTIKRHGTHRGPMSHGSNYHRGPGSMGACSDPSRVFKGKKLPGHMGNERVTVQNLIVVKVDNDKDLIVVKGAVPGPKGGWVSVVNSVKG